MKFRKKPVVIDAIQFVGHNIDDIENFAVGKIEVVDASTDILVHTLEGPLTAKLDDWIIRGVKGEYYPCKPDIFEATYEKVSES